MQLNKSSMSKFKNSFKASPVEPHQTSNPTIQNEYIEDDGSQEKNIMTQRSRKNNVFRDNSLNRQRRTQEYNRILNDNEAMLKRLQSRQSNYNVIDWENDRKNQIKLIKQICQYKPSITKSKKSFKKRHYQRLDMEKRFASAGPNKQMFEMYNLSMRQTGMPTALSIMESNKTDTQNSRDYGNEHSSERPDQNLVVQEH